MVTIETIKNGPYIVKGEVELMDSDGNKFPVEKRMALCRCGALLAHRDAFDLVAIDHDSRIRHHFAVGGINQRRANECDAISGPDSSRNLTA